MILANGQDIDYSEEKKMPPGLHLPVYWEGGAFFHNIQTYLSVYTADLR